MEEFIVYNECFNEEGKHIHLYRNSGTGLWTAYGYSAYKVAEMRKRRNHVSMVENYSGKMLMPVIIFGDDTFKYITSLCRREEENPDYTRLAIPEFCANRHGGLPPMGKGLERSPITVKHSFRCILLPEVPVTTTRK